jgi:hypothetical protein
MTGEVLKSSLDQHLRLRLADLDDVAFERFFLGFLNSGIVLSISRKGKLVERRVIDANTYAAGTGRAQKGIDLIAKMEGGETWAFQCKRRKEWSVSQTRTAVEAATYAAQHYFLLVACDPHKDVQDEMDKHEDWSFWNLDRICEEFRQRVPVHKQPQLLTFLAPEELKRFAPYMTDALIPAQAYFSSTQPDGSSCQHRYKLVGRKNELGQIDRFAKDPGSKVLKISGNGGEGKSRLLWELANIVEAGAGAPRVLFLNPRSTGDLTLAVWDKDQPRIIVVDDAHRLERVSVELLSRVRQASATKLVLATRPQGNEALDERLRDHGLGETKLIELTPLKKGEMEALAIDALGDTLKRRAKDLIALTGDSPFLTTLAGDLLNRGRLRWGEWHSVKEFRAAIFRSFEADNLECLGELDRKHGARLLRTVALLAPVTVDAVFNERAASCLSIPKVDIEALMQRMQGAGIISKESRNIRVIPDLFSDFLVFETAFDPTRCVPEFVRVVLQQFSSHAAAMLRNLAEASWVGGEQSPHRDELLKPLLEVEFIRFDEASFYERAQMVEQWTAFSVFLPGESIALAQKAITQRTAAQSLEQTFPWEHDEAGINSHRYVRSWVPSLLKPVALWHDDYRHAALDVLWNLGLESPQGSSVTGRDHPWLVIAEILKFKPRKPVHIIMSALDWVDRLVGRCSVKKAIVSHRSMLNTLLEPCFDRFVEFTEWQGLTASWWQQPVDIMVTAPIRTRALAILERLIGGNSWLLALEAMLAVERALRRVAPIEASRVQKAEKFGEDWRPERLKALSLLDKAIQRHPHVMVRFAIRQLLLRDLAYEEDPEFSTSVRKLIALVPDSFDLRLVTVINTQGSFEFAEGLSGPLNEVTQSKVKALWSERVGNTAKEFLQMLPTSREALVRLEQLTDESLQAGYRPNTTDLMSALASTDPDRAVALGDAMLAPTCTERIATIWHQILYGLPATYAQEAARLISLASDHPRTDLRRSVVDYFHFRDRNGIRLSAGEQVLLERMASKAGPDELLSFVSLVQWVGPECAKWGFELLGRLPLTILPPSAHGQVLAALNPYHAREVGPPRDVVTRVLDSLIPIPELDVDPHGGGYERVRKLYPRAIYDFVLKRAALHEELGPAAKYRVLPRDILARFELPGLENEPDFPAICAHLWEQTIGKLSHFMGHVWRELFQGVVLDHTELWLPKFEEAVRSSSTYENLRGLVEILHFDGSLVFFRIPRLTKLILSQAEDLSGTDGYKRMRSSLLALSGPVTRSFSNGELDQDSDFVEAEAIKAASTHAADDILGPFYRWIAEAERHDRERSRKLYQASLASMDEH